jgi:hypothetical protein
MGPQLGLHGKPACGAHLFLIPNIYHLYVAGKINFECARSNSMHVGGLKA